MTASNQAPGGMLRWAIPEFRLPGKVLEKELEMLKKLGIDFQCGIAVGKDKAIDELIAELRENPDNEEARIKLNEIESE